MAETPTASRKCSECRKPFLPRRQDYVCCSPACTEARHQRRKRERKRAKRAEAARLRAEEMIARGLPPPESRRGRPPTPDPDPDPASPPPLYRLCARLGCGDLFRPAFGGDAYCSRDCRARAALDYAQAERKDGGVGGAPVRPGVPALRREMLAQPTRAALDGWHRETAKLVSDVPDAGVSGLLRDARKRMQSL